MKKICILLALALLITLIAPVGEVFAAQNAEGAYIVKLRENTDSVRLFSNIETEEIYGEAGLYLVDSYADVKRLGTAVEYYEPDAVATLFAETNDKYSNYQWNLGSVSVTAAWNRGYRGAGVRVAVIDSGVNSMHEDFEGVTFEKGGNMLDGSHDVTDETGHGTFVTGTLAAAVNNYVGIAGLCDGIVIIPMKCFSNSNETEASKIVAAIYEAVDIYKCDVLNLSLGIKTNLMSLRTAIDYAVSKGVIVVSAVGNDGNSSLNYPAAYSDVVGVGAVDSAGKVTSFSQRNNSVFVTAPGKGLVGLGHESSDDYVKGDGTSYAVPHVVAAAVFLKEFNHNATVDDFIALLLATVKDAGSAGYDTSYGYGVLDIGDFVELMDTDAPAGIGDKFPDVAGHWAEEEIALCVAREFFNGVTPNRFAPEELMTRAMFVTVLSRMSGENIGGFPNLFLDVPGGEYYTQACGWGSAAGIITGVGDGQFNPNGLVTREQMAVFLYRFSMAYGLAEPGRSYAVLAGFSDANSVSSYALEALSWAYDNGLITGRTSTTLVPGGEAKRSEVAAIIARFVTIFMD